MSQHHKVLQAWSSNLLRPGEFLSILIHQKYGWSLSRGTCRCHAQHSSGPSSGFHFQIQLRQRANSPVKWALSCKDQYEVKTGRDNTSGPSLLHSPSFFPLNLSAWWVFYENCFLARNGKSINLLHTGTSMTSLLEYHRMKLFFELKHSTKVLEIFVSVLEKSIFAKYCCLIRIYSVITWLTT